MLPLWLEAWPLPADSPWRQVVENRQMAPLVRPLKDDVVGGVREMLWVLMGTIGIVLLIACANVANLMLVRSESRRQEFAVRTSLGAGRGDIAREVLVESLVLSLSGALLGIALASASLRVIVTTAPATLPRIDDIALEPRSVAFAVAATLLSTVLFGTVPAVRAAARAAPSPAGHARGASASRERQRTRSALVVVQVALALVLLVGAGLMVRTFQALLHVHPGFSIAGVALGLLTAVALTRWMSSLLVGVERLDPLTYAAVLAVLALAAALASYVPARRAAAGTPIQTLTGE